MNLGELVKDYLTKDNIIDPSFDFFRLILSF